MMIDKEEWSIIKLLTTFKTMIWYASVFQVTKLKNGFQLGLQKHSMISISLLLGSQDLNTMKLSSDHPPNPIGTGLVMLLEVN